MNAYWHYTKRKPMTINPTKDNVLIETIPTPKNTTLIMLEPKQADTDNMSYRVLACGPEVKTVKVGDKVLAPPLGGYVLREDKNKETVKRIFSESFILAVVT
jgi:co-chaperonin GroES (HSP10)